MTMRTNTTTRLIAQPEDRSDKRGLARALTGHLKYGAAALASGAVFAGLALAPADAQPVEVEKQDTSDTSTTSTTEAPAPTPIRLQVGRQDRHRTLAVAERPHGVLANRDIDLDRNDQVLVVRDGREVRDRKRRALRTDDLIKVVRVKRAVRTHRGAIKRPVRTRKVANLAPGKREVVRPGRRGVRVTKVHLEWHNGRRVSREAHREVMRKPRPRIVHVGQQHRTVPGTGHLNWAALARCESGGNPRAVNPAGYYGLYQFNVATWRSVGGSGMPHHAAAHEQTYRAQKLYASRGRSPWPHCGRYL